MTDTLEEAFAQADADLNNSEDSTDDVENEVEETEDTSRDESSEESTEPSDEDNSESFTNINPEELPEELKGTYKSLQADYTKKRQQDAESRKQSEARVKELEEKLAELEQSNQQPSTPQDQLKSVIRGEIEAEKSTEYGNQALKDYEAADPRLKLNSDTYDEATDLYVGQKMDARLEQHVKDGNPIYTFDHNKALKDILSEWDGYVQNKQKAFLEEQSKKAKSKTKRINKQNPKGRTGPGRPKKMSLDDAISVAIQES